MADCSLCPRCSRWGFEADMFKSKPKRKTLGTCGEDERNVKLGLLQQLLKNKSCDFCRFIGNSIQSRTPEILIMDPTAWCSLRVSTQQNNFSCWSQAVLCVYGQSLRHEIELLPLSKPFEGFVWSGRDLNEKEIDIVLIHNWITACQNLHETCERNPSWLEESGLIDTMCVIDVQANCLTHIKSSETFVALSYVWGQISIPQLTSHNRQILESPGGLKTIEDKMPNTITDAIRLTRLLRERYLWIDSLCIIQDDRQNKHGQFRTMHLIYGMAKLVIIEASGSDANTGLPGIFPRPRDFKQPLLHLSPDLRLTAAAPELESALSRTKWSQRGWTMQEALLARRRLIFTHNTAYFDCDAVTIPEDRGFNSEDKVPYAETIWDKSSFDNITRWFRYKSLLETYYSIVQKYTTLKFTFEKDILYAISGVMGALGKETGTEFLQGLPETHFGTSLLWHPAEPLERRLALSDDIKRFPSWSWAGWIGRISSQSTVRDIYAAAPDGVGHFRRGLLKSESETIRLRPESKRLEEMLLRLLGEEAEILRSWNHLRLIGKSFPKELLESEDGLNMHLGRDRPPTIDWFAIDPDGRLRPIPRAVQQPFRHQHTPNFRLMAMYDLIWTTAACKVRPNISNRGAWNAKTDENSETWELRKAISTVAITSSLDSLSEIPSIIVFNQNQHTQYIHFRTLEAKFHVHITDSMTINDQASTNTGAVLQTLQILGDEKKGREVGEVEEHCGSYWESQRQKGVECWHGNSVVKREHIGNVALHSCEFDLSVQAEADFVIASRRRRAYESLVGTCRKRRLSGTDYESQWIFDCMMIIWKNGIAERIGLGTILESAWARAQKSGQAKIKEIILG